MPTKWRYVDAPIHCYCWLRAATLAEQRSSKSVFTLVWCCRVAGAGAVSNAVSWRSEGIRYKKNEVRALLCMHGRLDWHETQTGTCCALTPQAAATLLCMRGKLAWPEILGTCLLGKSTPDSSHVGKPSRPEQVFLDVVESVNLLVNSNGTVVRSEVVGALKMRTFLSGMPECKLGLNDKARSLLRRGRASADTCCRPRTPRVCLQAHVPRLQDLHVSVISRLPGLLEQEHGMCMPPTRLRPGGL